MASTLLSFYQPKRRSATLWWPFHFISSSFFFVLVCGQWPPKVMSEGTNCASNYALGHYFVITFEGRSEGGNDVAPSGFVTGGVSWS